MTYSRQHPSPRYVAMMDQYKSLHTGGSEQRQMSAQETYPGISLFPHIRRIKTLIETCGAQEILDYGAGKGLAYSLSPVPVPGVGKVDNLMDYWDVNFVHSPSVRSTGGGKCSNRSTRTTRTSTGASSCKASWRAPRAARWSKRR